MPTLYAQLSNGSYASYDGMSQDTVAAMLMEQGLTATWITQEQYQTAIQAI